MIYSFVLSHPQVTFTIKWDDKEKEIFKAVEEGHDIERIAQVFFAKKTDTTNLIYSEESYDGHKVQVYFTKDTHTTPQYRHHYLFANKRFFQDKSLHQALLRNLDAYWKFGESGHYVVNITTPAEEIDVNVHPNKIQIKFLRTDVVYSLLVTSLKAGVKKSLPTELFSENLPKENAQSFFSKDENQSFDLMNFSSSGEMSESTQENSLFQREFNRFEVPKFQRIQDEFIIADLGKPYLVDLKKLMLDYFSNELEVFSVSEESTGPLLISEPFKVLKGKIDTHFEDLKALGFEFDRLNAEYIVLRTIPRFLPQSLLFSLSETLIKYFERTKTQEFEKKSYKKFLEENFSNVFFTDIPDSLIEKLIHSQDYPDCMLELTAERLKSLFK